MIVTLMYHLIDNENLGPMVVRVDSFRDQLDWLVSSHVPVISLDDGMHGLAQRQEGSPPMLAISFDDGYANTISVAQPEMAARGMVASMALNSDAVLGRLGPACLPHASTELADVSMIDRWLAGGNRIMGHGRTHRLLRGLSGSQLADEVEYDKEVLERLFGSVSGFAYPFGKRDASSMDCVREHYDYAVVTDGGLWPAPEERYEIRRLPVDPGWSADVFELRCREALHEAVSN